MKRRIFEWILVSAFLIAIGYFLRLQPITEDLEQKMCIATDLPESIAHNLVKSHPISHEFVYFPSAGERQWKEILKNKKIDIFLGSQDFLLWAARNQQLQPLKKEFMEKNNTNACDSLGRWVGIWTDPWVVVYNRERMPNEEVGNQFLWQRDTSAKKYRWIFPDIGNPNGDQRNIQFYHALFNHFGEKFFYDSMIEFRPEIQNYVDNSSHGIRMVLLGQADFALTHYSDLMAYQQNKLPLAWLGMEVNPTTIYGVGISHKTRQWDQVNKLIALWQSPVSEWEKKNQIPWFRIESTPVNMVFEVGILNDNESQTFLDEWLSEFRFGTLRKEMKE